MLRKTQTLESREDVKANIARTNALAQKVSHTTHRQDKKVNRRFNLAALQKRALAGNDKAQFELARRFWLGEGVAENKEKALKWYRLAAEQGNSDYQMAYGLILCWEDNLQQGFQDGFNWICKAAKQGHIGAQYFVAVEYAIGDHIKKNLFKAAKWYQSAAALGHPEAQYNLALMLWEGQGVTKDITKAQELLISSAMGGELLAIRALYEAYRDGLYGFLIDGERAEYWRQIYEKQK